MIECGSPTINAELSELAAYQAWSQEPGAKSLEPEAQGLFMFFEQGAEAPLFCATAPELGGMSGRYYNRCREARCNPLADDPALGRELWDRSESAVG